MNAVEKCPEFDNGRSVHHAIQHGRADAALPDEVEVLMGAYKVAGGESLEWNAADGWFKFQSNAGERPAIAKAGVIYAPLDRQRSR